VSGVGAVPEQMSLQTILYQVADGIARLTLNRPEKLNAISLAMEEELSLALWDADRDPTVHVVWLCGAGRAFSAGYDISPTPPRESGGQGYGPAPSLREDTARIELGGRLKMAIWDMHKPVIAQVHGYCLAGGTDLAFLADIVLVAEDAIIGFPPVRAQGSPPHHMWTYLAGPQWAKYMLLTGDTISGSKAADIGLALKAVPDDRLEAETEQLARKLSLIDVDLLAANKRICQVAMELMGARTIQRLAAEMDARAHLAPATAEFRRIAQEEGLKAAVAWRDERFKGD
jgi:enoyl-CoA hydratase